MQRHNQSLQAKLKEAYVFKVDLEIGTIEMYQYRRNKFQLGAAGAHFLRTVPEPQMFKPIDTSESNRAVSY